MTFKYSRVVITACLTVFAGIQTSLSQTVYNFTNAGAIGKNGPSQAMINTAYSSTNLNGKVTSVAGIQRWIVPFTGKYSIEAKGAQGGGAGGGFGAQMKGDFNLIGGDTLFILVGQQGQTFSSDRNIGGGGGSYVVEGAANNILLIAGGGGAGKTAAPNSEGTTAQNGQNGVFSGVTPQGAGGTGGNGGGGASCRGGGGAGWLTAGAPGGCGAPGGQGGIPFPMGGLGGGLSGTGAEGGFGGGGSSEGTNSAWTYAGGGGGYSGGGGASEGAATVWAGGGGSINNGINQANVGGTQPGDGVVIITSYPTAPNDAGIAAIISPTNNCAGMYNVEAVVANFGTNQITNVQINWKINAITQTPLAYAMLLDTANGTGQYQDTVTLGTITLTGGITDIIEAWTTLPNNVVDTSTSNDKKTKSVLGYAFPNAYLGNDTIICPAEFGVLEPVGLFDSVRWSTNQLAPSIVVVTPGAYSVKVYKNGCESRDTVLLSHYPPAPSIDFGPDTTICFNDSLILDATKPGVTYEWQNSSTAPTQTVKTAGTYWVILEDGNTCNSSDTINVKLFKTPTITQSVSPGTNVCFGTPITFTAFGKSEGSIMYQWKVNGVNSGAPTATNTFSPTLNYGDSVSVDLITDLCAASGTITIPSNTIKVFVNPQPRPITGADTILENTSAVYAVGISATGTYLWSVVGGTISGSNTNNTVTVDWGSATSGTVTCAETDKGCTYPNEKKVAVVSIVGIKGANESISMGYAYPNPAQTNITIPIVSKGDWDISLNLFDITGKQVKSIYNGAISGSKQITVAVDDLDNGMYFYKITTSNGQELVRKVSIQH